MIYQLILRWIFTRTLKNKKPCGNLKYTRFFYFRSKEIKIDYLIKSSYAFLNT